MKKQLLGLVVIIIIYYTLAGVYFELILPYPVLRGSFLLTETNQEFTIEYNDPDISYRDLLVEITNEMGNPIEIIYTKCSDEARLTVNAEQKVRFYHNFAGIIIILLLEPFGETNGTFKVIDRASFLVPKSASKACTNFSRLVFVINITVILFSIIFAMITIYVTLYKREQLKKYLKL
ncbi:MAG: hypothetical protein ACW99Q_26360 [Candidatus Kariarchaeaceae archaeon]|jgi:hypothetical protein